MSARSKRMASRSRRLMRFRFTDLPMARGTVKPTLPVSRCGLPVSKQNAAKSREVYLAPSS